MLQSYFYFPGDRWPNKYLAVDASVDCLAAYRYRDYKLQAYNNLKEHEPSRSYIELSVEEWQKCINFFTSLNFMARSAKNKGNQLKINTQACRDQIASLLRATIRYE
ncbi:hypothetical protein Adt_32166 [Abeliophyllum distichum]|uniref:Uncharacterized protein n=1 Tax=Abeliophyllum distichum TaxID=126358 RepID=A0ABD1RG64_9LAMI